MPKRRPAKRKATSQLQPEGERQTRSRTRAFRRVTSNDQDEAGPSSRANVVPEDTGDQAMQRAASATNASGPVASTASSSGSAPMAATASTSTSHASSRGVVTSPSVSDLLQGTSGGSTRLNDDHVVNNVQAIGSVNSYRPSAGLSVVNVITTHGDTRPSMITSLSNTGVNITGVGQNIMNGTMLDNGVPRSVYTGSFSTSVPNVSNLQLISSDSTSNTMSTMPLSVSSFNHVNNQNNQVSGTTLASYAVGGMQSMNVSGTQALNGGGITQQGSMLGATSNAVNTVQLGVGVPTVPVNVNSVNLNQTSNSGTTVGGYSVGSLQPVNANGSQVTNVGGLAHQGLVPAQFNPLMMNTIASNSITTPGSVPMMDPLVSVCSPLAASIPQALKTKIIGSEFVDFGLLLEKSEKGGQEQKDFSLTVGEGGRLLWHNNKPKREVNSIYSWTTAFLIYSSVYLSAHPQRAQELLKYAHIVRTAANRHEGWGWRVYDIQFRMRQQWNPLRSWALIDGELWTLYVSSSPVRSTFSQAQGGLGQSKTRKEGSMSNAHNFRAFNQKKGRDGASLGMSAIEFRKAVSGKLCFDFNSSGCTRQKCKFMHKCSKCSGINHGAQKCAKGANK